MTEFYWNGNIDKLIHQNNAETTDFYYGSLVDNCLLACKRGVMAVYEHYMNPNQSNYRCIFASDKEADKQKEIIEEFINNRNESQLPTGKDKSLTGAWIPHFVRLKSPVD